MNKAEILKDHYGLYIDGEWTDGSDGEKMTVVNPSNSENLATFINATKTDVDHAVNAAEKAYKSWKHTTRNERAEILNKLADKVEENIEKLATIETLDNGRPYRESWGMIKMAADHYRYFASAITVQEDGLKEHDSENMTLIVKEPVGVVGQIIPWNGPFTMFAWKTAPALAAGNTTVVKPASDAPLSILAFAEELNDVLRPGIINIVTGKGSQTGDALQNHEGIKKLAFTGSTKIGRQIGISAAERIIPSTLELGGKSANIIFNDANLDQAAAGAVMAILMNQGEVCAAGSRILIQDDIYDEFVERLIARFENLKVGDPFDEETEMGAQVSEEQMETVLKYFETANEEGDKILTGGERYTEGDLSKGFFIRPTIIETNNQSTCAREEIFGPVATVIRFKDVKEAVEIANDTEYGLAGGVFSTDVNKAIQVSKAIETGTMWVNTYNQLPAGSPFGGYKKSGIGRENHKMVLEEYTQTKSIFIHTENELDGS